MDNAPLHFGNIARSPGESVAPDLFPQHAWIPSLGCQGGRLFDVAGISNVSPSGSYSWTQNGITQTSAGAKCGSFDIAASDNFSIVISFMYNTTGFGTALGRFLDSTATTTYCAISAYSVSYTFINMFINNAQVYNNNLIPIFSPKSRNTFCVSSIKGNKPNCYFNGSKKEDPGSANGTGMPAGTFTIGNRSLGDRTFDGTFYTVLFYNKSIDDNASQQLSADPLLPFRRRKPVFYSMPASGFRPGWYRKPTLIGGGLV